MIYCVFQSPGLTVFKSLGYAISTLCQIFFYTYGGSIINEESAAIVNSYYNSNWYTAAPRKRKDLCTAMILAQGGTKIDAGLFELTLNTFARVSGLWFTKMINTLRGDNGIKLSLSASQLHFLFDHLVGLGF